MKGAFFIIQLAYEFALWRSLANNVFFNNIAIVIGPTPPGTGVI